MSRRKRVIDAASTMSLPIRLISTDFDGTLFAEFESPPIPEPVQELIGELQSRGAKWGINTGRDMSSLMEALARAHPRGTGLPGAGRAGDLLPRRLAVPRPGGMECRLHAHPHGAVCARPARRAPYPCLDQRPVSCPALRGRLFAVLSHRRQT